MPGNRVVLHDEGFRELLRYRVQAMLKVSADAIAAAAGDGMTVDPVHLSAARASVNIFTETPAAKAAEATGRALTRAFDAGRQ